MIKKNNKRSTRALTLNVDKRILKSKRSQNEIVGFVMIVVIVVIIGLFLLVFYLGNRKSVEVNSKNAQNFLKASLLYTTPCRENINLLDIQDMTKKCYNKEQCEGGEDSCVILNETYSQLLENAWKINSNSPVNYYFLEIYYWSNSSENGGEMAKEGVLVLEQGNCTGAKTGAEELFPYQHGDMYLKLHICSI